MKIQKLKTITKKLFKTLKIIYYKFKKFNFDTLNFFFNAASGGGR